MQRPEAKNPPERPLLSAETGNVENRWQDPRRNGLFSIDDGFRGSGRLGGGVRSQIRTGLGLQIPENRAINRAFGRIRALTARILRKVVVLQPIVAISFEKNNRATNRINRPVCKKNRGSAV